MDDWMQDPERNASFSLAKPFPKRYRFYKSRPQDPVPDTARVEAKGDTERDPQVAAAEEQAQESLSRSFVSECSTQVDDNDGQSLNTPDVQSEKRRIDAFRPNGQSLGWIANHISDAHNIPNDRPFNFWDSIRLKCQRPLAEWLGTTIFIFIGISGNLSVFTSDFTSGSMQSIYWCWGFAVMLAIYISGGGSGAFLNPALTIMLSIFRGFPAKRVPVYVFVQILGAFTGAVLAFAIHKDDIMHLDGALIPASTGIAFYTEPKEWVHPATAFFSEVLGTAVIACSILALGDASNSPPGAGMHAFIIGLLTVTATMSLGYNTGGCFNPARDLGPRLATIVVGYPISLFDSNDHWWLWGPWCATISGALLGGFVYDLCIFKGSESPVNYSSRRWRQEVDKSKRELSETIKSRRNATCYLERKLEAGELGLRSSASIEMHFEPDGLEFDENNKF